MKCPLLAIVHLNQAGREGMRYATCLKDEWAWWDDGPECCIFKSGTYTLIALSQEIAEIKDKMPHANQFTK